MYFQYSQPAIHPQLPLHILPAHEENLSADEGEFSCCRTCKASRAEERHLLPSPLLSPTSWLSSFCSLLLSYFSCLYSDSLLHLGFLLCACSLSGLSLHFVLAPWIFSYCLFPTFSSVCDSAGQDKSSPSLFLKMNHPGEKAVG